MNLQTASLSRSKQEKPKEQSCPTNANSCWHGARRHQTRQGYVQLTVRDRERKLTRSKMEHIVVWERRYGTSVPAGFIVHHRDENRRNNRIGNLACMPTGAHVEMHAALRRLRARLPPEEYAARRKEIMRQYELEVFVPEPPIPAQLKWSQDREEPHMNKHNAIDIRKIRKVLGMTGKEFGYQLSILRNGITAKPVPPTRLYEWETNRRSVPGDIYKAAVGILTGEWACRRWDAEAKERAAIDLLFASLINPALAQLLSVTSPDDSGVRWAREIFVKYVHDTYGYDIGYVWEGYGQ